MAIQGICGTEGENLEPRLVAAAGELPDIETGDGGKVLAVNEGETGYEYIAVAASAHTHSESDITDLGSYATAANPVFQGLVGLPIYSLDNLPDGYPGTIIFVSDANNGVGTIAFSGIIAPEEGSPQGSPEGEPQSGWIDVKTGLQVV